MPRLALPLVFALALFLCASADAGKAPASFELAAVGDMAMAPSSDPGAFFDAAVRHRLAADVTLGNLEGTLATGGSSKCGAGSENCFAFRAPPSYARVLRKAGFTVVNVANNHALDYGETGQAETLAAVKSAGLRHTGRPGEIAYLEQGGVRIAVIGVAPYDWAQDLRDIDGAVRLVHKADRRADVVIVTMHAGAEGQDEQHVHAGTETFLGENRGNPEAFAHAVIRAGADAVIGHGPHVLRGLEWYKGRPIAYSLGNFLGNGTLSTAGVSGVSAILHLTVRKNGSFVRGSLVPVQLTTGGLPRPDPRKQALTILRNLSREDFHGHGMRVTTTGRLLPPAWRTG
jgi:poly-gamma-glutamate capsule biosynthesis protein CapA/YwtB (metallophosphatase superfamily)